MLNGYPITKMGKFEKAEIILMAKNQENGKAIFLMEN